MSDKTLTTRPEQQFSLVPRTLAEAMEFGKLLASSELVPKDYRGKPANVVVAIQMGLELGLPPMQALQNVAVINGRPSVWGDGFWALITAAPEVTDVIEHVSGQGDARAATCKIVLRDREAVIRSFSVADAKKAGLWGKQGPWQQYPDRMLQMRARGFAGRDAVPHRLKGIQLAEEAMDIPSEPHAVPSEPRRVGASATVTPAASSAGPATAATEDAPHRPSAGSTTSDGEAPAAPPLPAGQPAESPPASPPSTNGVSWERGAKITTTGIVVEDPKDPTKRYYEISTTRGAYVTRDEQQYQLAVSLEDTDHTVSLAWRGARKGDKRLRLLVDLLVDEPGMEDEVATIDEGGAA